MIQGSGEKPVRKRKTKKIQEDYSMYEEDEKLEEDDELEDIIEEAVEEESGDSDGPYLEPGSKGKRKKRADQQETSEQRELRIAQKEELKNLKTQMLGMKD